VTGPNGSSGLVGRLVSVNVATPRTVEWYGRDVRSAIWKTPVEGPVEVRHDNLAGDDQADRRVHGGVDKAVYAYAVEDYSWWASTSFDSAFGPGTFGENLTTEGLDLTHALIGERWQVGSVVLEVCQPRFPCAKLGMKMGDSGFVDLFDEARRPGAYLRIVQEGQIETGDPIHRIHQPSHDLRIVDLVEATRNRAATPALLNRILDNPHVPTPYIDSATRSLDRQAG
jgi:MOSC domain-containing protein YiiM